MYPSYRVHVSIHKYRLRDIYEIIMGNLSINIIIFHSVMGFIIFFNVVDICLNALAYVIIGFECFVC